MTDKDTPFVAPAQLKWWDNEPSSTLFCDRYFSDSDGLRESQYVFIDGASVQAQWQKALSSQQSSTAIMELGFGSGLNFLATAQRWLEWRQFTPLSKHLHLRYFSIENQPMRTEDMRRALMPWRNSLSLTDSLIDNFPPRVRGQHRLSFTKSGIELVLLVDDVRTALTELIAPKPFIDAIYLDGFSPAANPAMWQHGVLQRLSELSHPRTTLATFSAAGELRRTLQRVGFDVVRRPGFGRKREMLCAVKTRAPKSRLLRNREPWFALPESAPPKHVAVIGAGLVGVSSASALARRGIDVTIFESAANAACATSAVPVAGWFPQLSLDFDRRSEILWQACRMLDTCLRKFTANPDQRWYDRQGCFFVADTADRQVRLKTIAERLADAGISVDFVDADTAARRTGLALPYPGLDCDLGGSVVPAELCRRLLQSPGIRVRYATTIDAISRQNNLWQLRHERGTENGFDAVVIASGEQTSLVDELVSAQYDSNLGVVTKIKHPALIGQRRLLCFKGYLTTALDGAGVHVTGATTRRDDEPITSTAQQSDENIKRLRHILPILDEKLPLQQSHGDGERDRPKTTDIDDSTNWQGRRLSSRDRLPMTGPVVDAESLRNSLNHYQRAAAMRDFRPPSFHDGLFVNLAHGGRGVSTGLLCAELLAQIMCGEPLCLPQRLVNALSPSRFLVRDILNRARQ